LRKLYNAVVVVALVACAMVVRAEPPSAAKAEPEPSPISEAETLLFRRSDLQSLPDAHVLHYRFSHRAHGEPERTDRIEVTVHGSPGSEGRKLSTRCFSGDRQVEFDSVDLADGNPALVCFLEHDIRATRALVQHGTPNYFRQRIRLALAERAEVKPVSVKFEGKPVQAKEIRIAPFLDDPHRAQFERYAGKAYVFRVSEQVPGGLLEVQTAIEDAASPTGPRIFEESLRLFKVGSARK
jgi:hypothetical protein